MALNVDRFIRLLKTLEAGDGVRAHLLLREEPVVIEIMIPYPNLVVVVHEPPVEGKMGETDLWALFFFSVITKVEIGEVLHDEE